MALLLSALPYLAYRLGYLIPERGGGSCRLVDGSRGPHGGGDTL